MNTLPLAPVDYIFTGKGAQPVTFAFHFSERLDPKNCLKSLEETLNYFPILKSQLVRIDEKTLEFQILSDEIDFSATFTKKDFNPDHQILDYITPVNSIPGEQLMRIRLTLVGNGSVLAVSISHALVDGFSYFHFLSSWSRANRGERFLPPSHLRDTLLNELNPDDTLVRAKEVYENCGLFYAQERQVLGNRHTKQERFYIPGDMIQPHLEEAKREYGISLTENDVIMGILWQKFLPSWNTKKGNPTTFITCPFDFRRVLIDFPKNYFGCALSFASASASLRDLQRSSVADLAILVHDAVAKIRTDAILLSQKTLEVLRLNQGLNSMEHIHLKHPDNGMIITNLSRMPIGEINFGGGSPVDYLVYADVLSSAAILPAREGVEVLVIHPSVHN